VHGKKGFVILTKSFVKIGITKTFPYNKKCLVLSTKRLVAAAKFLVAATKILSVVPDFVAVTKPFFSVCDCQLRRPSLQKRVPVPLGSAKGIIVKTKPRFGKC